MLRGFTSASKTGILNYAHFSCSYIIYILLYIYDNIEKYDDDIVNKLVEIKFSDYNFKETQSFELSRIFNVYMLHIFIVYTSIIFSKIKEIKKNEAPYKLIGDIFKRYILNKTDENKKIEFIYEECKHIEIEYLTVNISYLGISDKTQEKIIELLNEIQELSQSPQLGGFIQQGSSRNQFINTTLKDPYYQKYLKYKNKYNNLKKLI